VQHGIIQNRYNAVKHYGIIQLHARELRNTLMGGPVFLSKAEFEPWGCRNIAELEILQGSQKRRLG
jgi:hypothetical protein